MSRSSDLIVSRSLAALLLAFGLTTGTLVAAGEIDASRDILVTFENSGARAASSGVSAPYRNRKRYAIGSEARRHSSAIAAEYGLTKVDHWPIKHLSVYCFVYRIAAGESRDAMIDRLRKDDRVESAQLLNEFETGISARPGYDDTYAELQHGFTTLEVHKAHRYSRGRGIRIAVIDSAADLDHEDLKGRIKRVAHFADDHDSPDHRHGTAITSVIAALANNSKGIVGVAPEATVELFVACWSESGAEAAICDSFTLAKALDTVLDDPPHLLNLSLIGPQDPLLRRLLQQAFDRGVIIVAARSAEEESPKDFPASMGEVIGVGSSVVAADRGSDLGREPIFAPGERILVAVPDNEYDFRSGSSLAAAHVTGVIALLLDVAPDSGFQAIQSLLERSQRRQDTAIVSVNACQVLHLADRSLYCGS